MKYKKILFVCFIFVFGKISVSSAEPENLYQRFDGQNVKIYVQNVEDATAEKALDRNQFKEKIEEALKARKSIQFEPIQDPKSAALEIRTTIQEFYWTDHDPVDMIMGAAAIAMDAATAEDYARVQATVLVIDTKTNKTLWENKIMATVTKKPMSKVESIPLVAEDFAKVFIKQCFGKKH